MVYALTLRYYSNMKPLNQVSIVWSGALAYCIGLIASDGNLSADGRHITFVSKDLDLIITFCKCLRIKPKISLKNGGFTKTRKYYYVQFGDIHFYKFLLSLGLTPSKSKTIGALKIPPQYFFDFLRGSFDGDGSFYSYWDKRWASSHMFYIVFISASPTHINWIRSSVARWTNLVGHLHKSPNNSAYQLRYAKTEAKIIIDRMYHDPRAPRLERKYKKVYTALAIERQNDSARVL